MTRALYYPAKRKVRNVPFSKVSQKQGLLDMSVVIHSIHTQAPRAFSELSIVPVTWGDLDGCDKTTLVPVWHKVSHDYRLIVFITVVIRAVKGK